MGEQRLGERAGGRAEQAGAARPRFGTRTCLAAVVGAGLAAALLTGCGADAGGPKKMVGGAAPASGDPTGSASDKGSASPSESQNGKNGGKNGGKSGGENAGDQSAPGAGGHGTGGTSDGKGGSGGTSGGNGGSGSSGGGSGTCKTSDLAIDTQAGMHEGNVMVSLKNTSSGTCTLKGFPGADLKGSVGTINADRKSAATPTVDLKPGEGTGFFLDYPPNRSGGSGATFSTLVVTPPNETRSKSVPISINLAVSAEGGGPGVTVGPVGDLGG
ncbi:hypothetical protein GCM10009863_64880 [Streptomyces axinellae]|uniref:DUF4232 domain-containing protein n=1 Tax=Streptomyces axinellae TaxID=552788 RepID=A0ABN3QYV5_9ACTN